MMKLDTFITVIIFFVNSFLFAQVGIGTTNPHVSSALEISSNNSGVLIPRLSDSERDAINNPATGLLIFNTTSNTFQYNFGSMSNPNWYTIQGNNSSSSILETSGYVQSNGTFTATNGTLITRESQGVYKVDFGISTSNNQYAVIATTDRSSGTDDLFIGVADRTNTSFRIRISDEDDGGTTNNYVDSAFSFNVVFIPSGTSNGTTSANEYGYVTANTGTYVGNGMTVTKMAAGHFRIYFTTPKNSEAYAVNATVDRTSGDDDTFIGIGNRTIYSFDVFTSDEDDGSTTNNYVDRNFSFIVY